MTTMDVRCPNCDTLYEIDAQQLRGGSNTLKCSQCEYIFQMQTHASLVQENQRRWMLRDHRSGDIRYFMGFEELHRWILGGVVTQFDEVSRTGRRWRRLGEVGEFMPIFQAADSIASLSAPGTTQGEQPQRAPAQHAPSAAAPAASGPHLAPQRPRQHTSKQFGAAATANRAPRFTPLPPGPPTSARSGAARSQSGSHPQPRAPEPAPLPGEAESLQAPEPLVKLPSASDEEWSLGDLPLGVAEGHGREASGLWRRDTGAFAAPIPQDEASSSYTRTTTRSSGGARRVLFISMIVFLLGAAVLAGLYFMRPALFEQLTGHQPERAESSPSASTPSDGATTLTEVLYTADIGVESALGAARERVLADALAANIEVARPEIIRGLERAERAASKAAAPRELSVQELLRSANRALTGGDAERARAQFHKAIDKQRDNVEAITGLGWALLALGNPSAAAAQFNKANAYNPGYSDAYIGLGTARRDLGETDAAIKHFETYLERFPNGTKASIARYQLENLQK